MDKTLMAAVLVAIVFGVAALGVAVAAHRGRRRRQRRAFIDRYAFPPGLRRKIGERHPSLSLTQVDRVLEGLRSFFRACLAAQSRRKLAPRLGMPSRVVDDAWHDFILMTEAYSAFCRQAFGRYLHHAPEGEMRGWMQDALANTLHFIKAEKATGPSAPGAAAFAGAVVPILFMIDRELGIDGGATYTPEDLAALEARRQHLAAMHAASGDAGGCATGGTGACVSGHAASCDGGGASCGAGAGCGSGCGSS